MIKKEQLPEMISFFVVSFYFFLVFYGQNVLVDSISPHFPIIVVLIFFAVLSTKIAFKFTKAVILKEEYGSNHWKWFVGGLISCLAVGGIYYLVNYPGMFSGDSENQLEQALSGYYSDWHPFIHTFLFFTLPMKIFGCIESIILLQIVYYSFAVAYLTYVLRKNGCPKILCIIEILMAVVAPYCVILTYPWKDCGLAIFAILITACYVNIICSNGQWMEKKRNICFFALVLVLGTLIRHNAILFTLPVIIGSMLYGWKKRKQLAALVILIITLFAIVKMPVYSIFGVEKPNLRTTETMGICMTMIGNAVVENPEALDSDILNFMYAIAPAEVWEEHYQLGEWNYVKWNEQTSKLPIEEAGIAQILNYTGRAILECPEETIEALLCSTGMVWQIDGKILWDIDEGETPEVTWKPVTEQFQDYYGKVIREWRRICLNSVLKYPLYYLGFWNVILLIFAAAKIKRWMDFKIIVHILPIFCYNFGTALLLSGFDWRFFFCVFVVVIPFTYLVMREKSCSRCTEGENE